MITQNAEISNHIFAKAVIWFGLLATLTFSQTIQGAELAKGSPNENRGNVTKRTQGIEDIQAQVGNVTINMIRIPAGVFRMGSLDGSENERPVHTVTISHGFWMGKYTVTQAQFQTVMGQNPGNWKRPENPVNQVTWDDVQAFFVKLNGLQDGFRFRLPTEAEWEYACRAGTTEETYGSINNIAWCGNPFFGSIHPVGQKEPNAFGLYDMLGNVIQWCQDIYSPYQEDDQIDPIGPIAGQFRVARGGAFYDSKSGCRAPVRHQLIPNYKYRGLGFRVVAIERER